MKTIKERIDNYRQERSEKIDKEVNALRNEFNDEINDEVLKMPFCIVYRIFIFKSMNLKIEQEHFNCFGDLVAFMRKMFLAPQHYFEVLSIASLLPMKEQSSNRK